MSAPSKQPLIELSGVTKRIGDGVVTTLVRDINLRIDPGEFVAIMGPSGSGKSSLLYLLGLLDVPTAGHVIVEGRDTEQLSEADRAHIRLSTLGFVFQFHFLLPEFSALTNVMLPMRALGRTSEAAMRARAENLLSTLGLGGHMHKLPGQLSGGQRQRVAIARALANEPKVLLADEPTGNLDSVSSEQVLGIFRKLVDETGRAIVMVTHDPGLGERADRLVRIVDGRIVNGHDAEQVSSGRS